MKYLTLVLILMAVPVPAEELVVTDDGKTVLLKDDGTWEYTEEGERKATEEREERKEFWTNIAINAAKIVGIIAILLIVRLVIRAIGKGVGIGKDQSRQQDHKATED